MNFSPTRYHDEAAGASGQDARESSGRDDSQLPSRPASPGVFGAFLIATLMTALLAFILGAWVRVLVVLFDAGWGTL